MYKVRVHVEDYFMPIKFGSRNYGSNKVDCNKIICCFFDENGKPKWNELFTCDQIIEMVDYKLPTNKKLKAHYKCKFRTYLIWAVNWLCEEHGLNIVQARISDNKRVCYGFTKRLQIQASSIDRKITQRNNKIERVKNRKSIADKKSLQLIKHEGEQCLERRAII